jgi:hypothetical protein
VLRNVTVKDGLVSGEVVNNSGAHPRCPVADPLFVALEDEFHPGTDDPGRAVFLTVDKISRRPERGLNTSRRRHCQRAKMDISTLASKLLALPQFTGNALV